MKVRLFLRLKRPDTQMFVEGSQIRMRYDNHLSFNADRSSPFPETNLPPSDGPSVTALERIISLNSEAEPTAEKDGLTIQMPVTMPDQGTKWRLVWCAHAALFGRYDTHWMRLGAGLGIACIAAQSVLDYPLRNQTLLCVAALLVVLLCEKRRGFS